jgi:transposase
MHTKMTQKKKIPLRRDQMPRIYTQEQVGKLIRYIDTDKMTLKEASTKANMPYSSGRYYYDRYLKDPNHNIPIPQFHQSYTQDQKNKSIDYVINDKMNIKAASKKAGLSLAIANYYYRKYFKQQNPDIATPNHIVTRKCYTQEQIKEVISYIVNDKMLIVAASTKANFNKDSAIRYHRQYLNDNNMEIPAGKKTYTRDNINEFIGYIVDDKMSIKAAAIKASMNYQSSYKYYHQYLKDHHLDDPIQNVITQKQKSELVGYIVDGKMAITAASKKANIHYNSGYEYYHQYQKDHHLVPIKKVITQEQQSKLIGYIVDDKMSIRAASKKANLANSTGQRYYELYLENQKGNGPTRCLQVVPAPKNE